jgi:hypothetical protein
MKRIVVTGSRDWYEVRYAVRTFKAYEILETLVGVPPEWAVGDCPDGIDKLFTDWHVNWKGYKPKIYEADWEKYGRAAGPIRNAFMLDDFRPDLVLAFPWHGAGNRGTMGTAALAIERGIDVEYFWGGTDPLGSSGDLQETPVKD